MYITVKENGQVEVISRRRVWARLVTSKNVGAVNLSVSQRPQQEAQRVASWLCAQELLRDDETHLVVQIAVSQRPQTAGEWCDILDRKKEWWRPSSYGEVEEEEEETYLHQQVLKA